VDGTTPATRGACFHTRETNSARKGRSIRPAGVFGGFLLCAVTKSAVGSLVVRQLHRALRSPEGKCRSPLSAGPARKADWSWPGGCIELQASQRLVAIPVTDGPPRCHVFAGRGRREMLNSLPVKAHEPFLYDARRPPRRAKSGTPLGPGRCLTSRQAVYCTRPRVRTTRLAG